MRGRWLAGFIIAILIAIIFSLLGIWQLNRNTQKHNNDRAAKAAYAKPAPPIDSSPPAAGSRVEASGTYDATPAHETLLRDQSHGDREGVDVLTPLQLGNGTAVIVDRGWIPLDASIPPPPAGPVVVRGLARIPAAGSNQALVEREGARTSTAVVDLDEIRGRVPYRLDDAWIEAQYQQPAPTRAGPALPEPPASDPVNHMEYAIQWFAFALIPIIGWPVLMNRRARRKTET